MVGSNAYIQSTTAQILLGLDSCCVTLLVSLAAVQNERQPRSTAHVSLESISTDTSKEHLATTQEINTSATYSRVITNAATIQASSYPSNNHRLMVSLLTAETCAKLEPEDGETMWKMLEFRV